jgi:hypothetical protein
LDSAIDCAVKFLIAESSTPNGRKGCVNYVITRIVLGSMNPETKWTYTAISDAVSVLRDAATEMERRLMAKREDKAIIENGDILEYE